MRPLHAAVVPAHGADVHPVRSHGTLVHHDRGRHVRGDRGDIITGWLAQLLVVMAVVGLVGYELLAVAIPALTLDGDAKDVAEAAANAYESTSSEARALEAAEAEAEGHNADVVGLVVVEDAVEVTVSRATATLFIHRIPGLEGTADVAVTTRARLRP